MDVRRPGVAPGARSEPGAWWAYGVEMTRAEYVTRAVRYRQ